MVQKIKRRNPESALQQNFVKWFRYQYPLYILFAIGNGGFRSAIEAAIMNGEGVLAGVPDLLLACPRGEWAGLFIELKIHPNKPTPKQVAVMAALVKAGYACQVCYELETGMQIVTDYLALPVMEINACQPIQS